MGENSDPSVRQKFVSEDGNRLASLYTYPCEEELDDSDDPSGFPDNRYMVWSDTQRQLPDVDHLKIKNGNNRELSMVHKEFKL